MDQPRSAPQQQPDNDYQQVPDLAARARDRRPRSLGERVGLVALGQVIAYLLRRCFD